jgi:serine phosphatase RsbU (regulator of sigma subunit)
MGDVGLYIVDAKGAIVHRSDDAESISFRIEGGELVVEPTADRRAHAGPVEDSDNQVVVTYDAESEAAFAPFLTALFAGVAEKELILLDMESMYSSSLALLEEVSMVGEMLPKLPTGDTEVDVVRMCLEALIVAASIESAIFVRFDEERELAEALVQVRADDDGTEYPGARFVEDGMAWRAIRDGEEAILESVPEGGALGSPGSPESFAKNEIIAVPVRYGGNDEPVTLGALLLLDKRRNAYSTTTKFGSQDTKLATSVAAMLASVLGTRKVAELGNELRNAQILHQQILPHGSPAFDGFDLAGASISPGAVGGDYYDFLELPDGRMMCVVADVSGHNLASCLVMVSARAALRLLASTVSSTGEVFDRLAETLYSDLSRTELFITAVCAILESGTRKLELANAGHNPTMIYRADTGDVEDVYAEDTVLGFLPAPIHDVATRSLHPGDVALLYTDGVTEATNSAGVFLEEDRLREILKRAAGGTAAEILDSVYSAVADFADADAEGDDISVVVIKVTE